MCAQRDVLLNGGNVKITGQFMDQTPSFFVESNSEPSRVAFRREPKGSQYGPNPFRFQFGRRSAGGQYSRRSFSDGAHMDILVVTLMAEGKCSLNHGAGQVHPAFRSDLFRMLWALLRASGFRL
jgi:hypothetical protein